MRARTRVSTRQLRNEAPLDQRVKVRKLRVASAGVAHVLERQRQILQITWLAIPIPQAREDPQHLDVALQADQIKPAQELALVATTGPAMRAQQVAIPFDPILDALARPADVAILEQGHQVVPYGSTQSILK